MTDDLDHELLQVFAATTVPLAADDFVRRLKLRVALRRRIRAVPRLMAVVALFLVGAFAAHALGVFFAAEQFSALLISPPGWTMSLVLAVVVVRRWRLLRV